MTKQTSENENEITEYDTNITVTPSAQGYLTELLAKQESDDIGVRIFVENAGTPRAECCMAYSYAEDRDDDDLCLEYETFTAYIDAPSVPYLLDAVIDYNADRFGGQLTFRAPNSKVPQVGEDASIEERIHYVLQSEINPSAVLKFGGGCQGCSAVDVTLRQGVEVQLKQSIPELTQVVDETDHTQTENAYYQ